MEKIMVDKYWLESFLGVDSFLVPSLGSEGSGGVSGLRSL